MRLGAIACVAVILGACGGAGSSASTSPTSVASPSVAASPAPALSASDRAEVAVLEKKPLMTPKPAADGQCHQGPFTSSITPYANGNPELEVYGTGPVYGQGGSPITNPTYVYFDVTYFTSPSVTGVVLVRINDLSGQYPGVFVGPLGVGKQAGTDTIQGRKQTLYSELALPAENPPANQPAAAPGWGVWHIRQGINVNFTCAAIQVDTATTSQVLLGH